MAKLEELIGNVYQYGGTRAKNCYNTGELSGGSRIGSIIGQCAGSSFASCWWTTSQNGSRK